MRQMKTEKGFTLFEVLIVVIVIGIISAAVIVEFSTIIMRTKINTDLKSVKTLQKQIEIYNQEKETKLSGTINEMVDQLVADGYLDERYLSAQDHRVLLQAKEAAVIYDAGAERVKLQLEAETYDLFIKGHEEDENYKDWLVKDGA